MSADSDVYSQVCMSTHAAVCNVFIVALHTAQYDMTTAGLSCGMDGIVSAAVLKSIKTVSTYSTKCSVAFLLLMSH